MSPASYQTAPPRVAYVLGGLGPLTIVEVNSRHTAAIGKAPFVSLRNIKGGFRPPMKANLAFQPSFVTAQPSFVTALPPLKSGKRDSNPRPQPWQGCALPTELFPPVCRVNTRRCRCHNNLSHNGGEGNRTPDLVNAIHALSQLSYAPVILDAGRNPAGNTAS